MIASSENLQFKSKSDKKQYVITEFQSGLQVLLVSTIDLHASRVSSGDVISLKAAAALTVQVGSFADPPECEGLAHFLEHMVFMGR